MSKYNSLQLFVIQDEYARNVNGINYTNRIDAEKECATLNIGKSNPYEVYTLEAFIRNVAVHASEQTAWGH